MFRRIVQAFSFKEQRGEFELLETERGEPGYTGGWRDVPQEEQQGADSRGIPADLEQVRRRIRWELRKDINPDVIARSFMLGGKRPALVLFMSGMVNAEYINEFILREGMGSDALSGAPEQGSILTFVIENVFSMCEIEVEGAWDKVKESVIDGKTAVFIQGEQSAVVMETRGYERRLVNTPQNEKTVKGPHEGFVENLRTNITLIRRIVRTDDLVCEFRHSGAGNNVKLAILYREGVTNATLVEEVKRRLSRVDTRMLLSSGALEQLLERHRLSPLPQLLSTERPDRASGYLMQGHVCVLLEGSPFASIMPVTLHALMSSPEDTYLRQAQGTMIRVVRYVGAVLSILLPGYFLALALYHQGLLSVEVLSTLVGSRKMVFAPLGSEMIFLLVVFQLIREAGLRVPGSIGQAIGIIGGLIMGQAAVEANLASSVVLIVVALSGLGNFCIPDYQTQITAAIIRLALVLASWAAGLLGMACAALMVLAWVCSLKSFGVPFLAPFVPKTYSKYPPVIRGKAAMRRRASDFTNTQEDRA